MQGGLKVCAIKALYFGDRRKAMLEDIAVSTGGTAIMEGSGVELKSLTLKELGKASKSGRQQRQDPHCRWSWRRPSHLQTDPFHQSSDRSVKL